MSKQLSLIAFFLLFVSVSYGADTVVVLTISDSEMSRKEDSLTNQRLTENINVLEKALSFNERNAGNWWKTWTILYGVATVGQGAVSVLTTDKSTRQDMIVGAGTTLLGMVGQLITPVHTGFRAIGSDSVTKLSTSEKNALLLQDKALLKWQADIAQAGKGWQVHALSGAVNLASGLITWIGFKRSFGEGVLNFALNTVVTEVQIWTQPMYAKKKYQKILWDLQEEGYRSNPLRSPEWYGQVTPASCRFGLHF